MTKQRRSQEARTARKQRIRYDAKRAVPENAMRRCIVWGCSKPPQLADATGLSPRLCRAHVKHNQRHGSPHRKTWPASELRPYIKSADLWLKQNSNQSMTQRVIAEMQLALETSGRPETAYGMLRADAVRKAKVALARLRVAGVKPERLVAIVLATWAIAEDDASERTLSEFRTVAVGKQAHRLSARWFPERARAMPKGSMARRTYEKYGESTGGVLRALGKAIDDVANHLVDRAVPHILALKRTKFGPHPSRKPLASERAA
jgi:hypothetical protein